MVSSESLHNGGGGGGGGGGKMNSLARSNASLYGTKDDLYDRLKRHAYPAKKGADTAVSKLNYIPTNRTQFAFSYCTN